MKDRIYRMIPAECPWRDTLYWYDTTDSTNTRAKELARQGAPQGTLVLAGQQTGGRGRMGRTFQSPPDAGVYLSVILRPDCLPAELMHLTCAVGVAMAEAIQKAAGVRADLKWINDLVWQKKKLGGILTELAIDPKTGRVEYAVVGIGINCCQAPGDFPEEIAHIAASLSIAAERPIEPACLAGEMIQALYRQDLNQKTQLMDAYRSRCITLGAQVAVVRDGERRPGKALSMNDDGALLVAYEDGVQAWVNSGEVSVRGLYDYV